MRAAVYLGDGEVRIEERPLPRPGPGEVLVAMRACGICGSDLMEWYVAQKAPAVLGHEPAGVVVEAGAELDAPLPAPGTRVFVHHHVPCGECEYCARGHETLCAQFKATRIEPGGFSELILVPALNAALDLLPLPETVSDEAATVIEPLACCVRALDRARVDATTRLLVIGGGQMGLLLAQAALARGASTTVAEPIAKRRELA
ncbi:MAG TPA: alcohol dehydrogenase catalytic domain-containing protein, partial [Solirubrobacter sp.]